MFYDAVSAESAADSAADAAGKRHETQKEINLILIRLN